MCFQELIGEKECLCNMNKEKLLEKFTPNCSYRKEHIENVIRNVDFRIKEPPSTLKKGDVIKISGSTLSKSRPGVVVKVTKDKVYLMPITSSENVHSIFKFSSRFWGDGWFCDSLIGVKMDVAKENFYGVFDSPKDLKEAILRFKDVANFI